MNEYYTPPAQVAAGSRARASQVNDINDAVDAGFDNIPAGLESTLEDLADTVNQGLPSLTGNAGKVLKVKSDEFLSEWSDILFDLLVSQVSEKRNDLGTLTGGTDNLDFSLGSFITATISTATQNFTASNWPTNLGFFAGFILLTNAGSQTVNFFTDATTIKWLGKKVPIFTTSGEDLIGFFSFDQGTTVYLRDCGLNYGVTS